MASQEDIGEILLLPTRVMAKLWSGSNNFHILIDGDLGQTRMSFALISRRETADLWRH